MLQKSRRRIRFGRGLWLALLLVSAVSSGAIAQSISGATVVSTIDGDTLQVNQNGQTLTLPGVNARGFFNLRHDLLRQDCSNLSRGLIS